MWSREYFWPLKTEPRREICTWLRSPDPIRRSPKREGIPVLVKSIDGGYKDKIEFREGFIGGDIGEMLHEWVYGSL
jgi:hypothetical protein